jgi:hypothetical protein
LFFAAFAAFLRGEQFHAAIDSIANPLSVNALIAKSRSWQFTSPSSTAPKLTRIELLTQTIAVGDMRYGE